MSGEPDLFCMVCVLCIPIRLWPLQADSLRGQVVWWPPISFPSFVLYLITVIFCLVFLPAFIVSWVWWPYFTLLLEGVHEEAFLFATPFYKEIYVM